MDHSLLWRRGLCNPVTLRATPCEATPDRQASVGSSDNTGSTGGGNGSHSSILAGEARDSMKRQENLIVEDGPPGRGVRGAAGQEQGALPTAPGRTKAPGCLRSRSGGDEQTHGTRPEGGLRSCRRRSARLCGKQ